MSDDDVAEAEDRQGVLQVGDYVLDGDAAQQRCAKHVSMGGHGLREVRLFLSLTAGVKFRRRSWWGQDEVSVATAFQL